MLLVSDISAAYASRGWQRPFPLKSRPRREAVLWQRVPEPVLPRVHLIYSCERVEDCGVCWLTGVSATRQADWCHTCVTRSDWQERHTEGCYVVLTVNMLIHRPHFTRSEP